jgi:hypothetical protein
MPRCFQSRTTWPLLCALGLCLAVGRGTTAEPASSDPNNDLKAIRTMLERIDNRLAAQQSQLTDAMVLVNKLMADVTALKDEHGRLQREVADLRNRPTNPTTTSYYGGQPGYGGPSGPVTVQSQAATPLSSRVRLVNTYFTDMTAVINGVIYTLRPGEERTLAYPPGNLTYQVLMVADVPQTRTLAPGEQLTLTLYPRR